MGLVLGRGWWDAGNLASENRERVTTGEKGICEIKSEIL
jgi:hypothetical protein